MGKQMGKYWGNNWQNIPTKTKTNHIRLISWNPLKPFIHRHRRPFAAVHVSFLRDSVGTRNGFVELVYLLVFPSFLYFVWGNIWIILIWFCCHWHLFYVMTGDGAGLEQAVVEHSDEVVGFLTFLTSECEFGIEIGSEWFYFFNETCIEVDDVGGLLDYGWVGRFFYLCGLSFLFIG